MSPRTDSGGRELPVRPSGDRDICRRVLSKRGKPLYFSLGTNVDLQ